MIRWKPEDILEYWSLFGDRVEGRVVLHVSESERDDDTAVVWDCGIEVETGAALALAARIEYLCWLDLRHDF